MGHDFDFTVPAAIAAHLPDEIVVKDGEADEPGEAGEAEHVVVGNNSLRCKHCGHEYKMALPISLQSMIGLMDGFSKDHTSCQASEAGAARFEYSTPDEWRQSWDTGTSSLAIYRFMLGVPQRPRTDIPHDPDDLGRCIRLLDVAPGWRERLPEMAQAMPAWQPLVDRWDELEQLYREERPTGRAPKLFRAMKEILDAE